MYLVKKHILNSGVWYLIMLAIWNLTLPHDAGQEQQVTAPGQQHRHQGKQPWCSIE
jgi:hypothetical protein